MVCPNISAVEWIWFNFTRPDTRLPVSADYQSDESRTGSRRNTSATTTIHLDNPTPIQLPPGTFLICGNGYVYPVILIRPKGGPCRLGRISMIPISLESIQQIRADNTRRHRCLDQLSEDCNDEVYLYGMAQKIFETFWIWPQIIHNIHVTERLSCWAAKTRIAHPELLHP